MPSTSPVKRIIDAGVHFGELTQQGAERLVRDMVKAGEARRKDHEQLVRRLVERSREANMRLLGAIRDEVARQVTAVATRFDEVEGRFEDLAARTRVVPFKRAGAQPGRVDAGVGHPP